MTSNLSFEVRMVISNPVFLCHCSSCNETFTIQYTYPRAVDSGPSACPLCKSPLTQVTEQSISMDVFDYIALDFNLNRETIEGLYELWAPPKDPIRFVDFVKAAIEGTVT